MVYTTPELRLVGSAHEVVLAGQAQKLRSGQEYEKEIDQTYSDVELEPLW